MTIPRAVRNPTQRLSDMVRDMIPQFRHRMTAAEMDLAIHLRGNEVLFAALEAVIKSRLEGRAKLPEPSDPLDCKSMVARDRELQWVLSKLEFIYRSPALQPADDTGEPPAE